MDSDGRMFAFDELSGDGVKLAGLPADIDPSGKPDWTGG